MRPVTPALAARLDDLPPAARLVGELVLADPEAAAVLTIKQMAARSGASTASILRLCRELGFAGYREFRTALAAEVAVRAQVWRDKASGGDITPGDDLAAAVAKITGGDVRAVQETARAVSLPTLEAAIERLDRARQIVVVGSAASGLVAQDLAQKMQRIGRWALAHADLHLGLTTASLLDERDCIVAVSHSGATVDTLDVFRRGMAAGASGIAITNAPRSSLARDADVVLLTAASEAHYRAGATASRLAQLVMVDCLFVGLAKRRPDESLEALDKTVTTLATRRV